MADEEGATKFSPEYQTANDADQYLLAADSAKREGLPCSFYTAGFGGKVPTKQFNG